MQSRLFSRILFRIDPRDALKKIVIIFPSRNRALFEPHWLPFARLNGLEPPREAKDWIKDQDSLTQRLMSISNGHFRVNVLQHGFSKPRLSEKRLLKIRAGQYALIREVQLLINEEPWVFARSIIPLKTLMGENRALLTLGTKPLGALLFNNPGTQRVLIEFAHFPENRIPFTYEPKGDCWGRRSLFILNKKPLLVGETFLPRALEYLKEPLDRV